MVCTVHGYMGDAECIATAHKDGQLIRCPGCEDCAKPCATCEGTGRKPTTLQGSTTTQWHSVHCPDCNGSGKEKP